MTIQLGRVYRDRITGFEGTATGFCEYISGCNQALLTPKTAKDGSYKSGEWFDVQRVEPVGSKLITLDNSRTPGPDKPAPKR